MIRELMLASAPQRPLIEAWQPTAVVPRAGSGDEVLPASLNEVLNDDES